MLATFRETAKSLQDLKYGEEIGKRTIGQALWYWTKYLLLFAVIAILGGVATLTYYTPQIGGLLAANLPDIALSVKNGQVETNVPQPFVQTDGNFAFIVDTNGTLSDLDNYPTGVLILKDKLVAKSETESRIVDLKEFEGTKVSRSMLVDWANNNKATLWTLGLVAIILLSAVGVGVFWLVRLAGFLLGAIVIFLAGLVFKKRLSYQQAFKLAIYASVLPLVISAFTFFSSSDILSVLSMAAFLFYSLAWVYNLKSR